MCNSVSLISQPAKKMRMDPPPSHSIITSPPPPVSSLTTTSHASLSSIKQPLVVPCEKRPPKRTQTINVNLAPLKTQFSGNNTGLLQKPHPLVHSPTSPTSRSGGKIRMTRHTSHYSSKNKEEDNDEVVNPMTLPPPISLHVPSSVTLTPFSISGLNPIAKVSEIFSYYNTYTRRLGIFHSKKFWWFSRFSSRRLIPMDR